MSQMQRILSIVSLKTNVSEYQIVMPDSEKGARKKKYVIARHLAMVFCNKTYGGNYTHEDIGKFFGNRDHSTVTTAIMNVNKKYEENEDFRDLFESIKTRIRGGAETLSYTWEIFKQVENQL